MNVVACQRVCRYICVYYMYYMHVTYTQIRVCYFSKIGGDNRKRRRSLGTSFYVSDANGKLSRQSADDRNISKGTEIGSAVNTGNYYAKSGRLS